MDKKATNKTELDGNDQDILNFYNLATSKILNSLETTISKAQSAKQLEADYDLLQSDQNH